MKVQFTRKFTKDVAAIRDAQLRRRVQQVIFRVEEAGSLLELADVKKLEGSDQFFRVRIGDYRVGFVLENDTVVFMRLLHRSDIYKNFP